MKSFFSILCLGLAMNVLAENETINYNQNWQDASNGNTTIMVTPTKADKKMEYRDGEAWPYYQINDIFISMSYSKVKDYGKYHRVSIEFVNNTGEPINLDTDEIEATLTDNEGIRKPMHIFSVDEYMKKVSRRQSWQGFFVGLGEELAAEDAGYSASTTTSKTTYNDHSSHHSSYSSYDNGRRFNDHSSSHNHYNGSSKTTSTTVTYDGAAAYQAHLIADQRMADFANAQREERDIKKQEYLKKTTIYPGESIAGYINIESKKGEKMDIVININGIPYNFSWKLAR